MNLTPFRAGALALALIVLPSLAWAQDAAQSAVDPRIAAPAIRALQAEMALRDAALKAAQEDRAKREADLAEWFKGWFGAPSKEQE